jgi:hypothetical protein
MAKAKEIIPRSIIDNALRMIGLPVDTTFKQIQYIPLEDWKKRYVAMYQTARWRSYFTPDQAQAHDRRFVDMVQAFNDLMFWQQGITHAMTLAEIHKWERGMLEEAEIEEMVKRAAIQWEEDAFNRLARIQMERERQAELREEASIRSRQQAESTRRWREFENLWNRITFDKSAEWKKSRGGLAARRAAWIMYSDGEEVTEQVARVLEARFGPRTQRYTPEMKRAAAAWYHRMGELTVRRWLSEMKMHPGGRLQLKERFSGFGRMFG